MNTKHVPDRELCQEFDRLCKEKGIVVPETEFVWYKSCYEGDCIFGLMKSKGFPGYPAPLVPELDVILGGTGWAVIAEDDGYHWVYKKTKESKLTYSLMGGHGMGPMDNPGNRRLSLINHLIAEGIITTL